MSINNLNKKTSCFIFLECHEPTGDYYQVSVSNYFEMFFRKSLLKNFIIGIFYQEKRILYEFYRSSICLTSESFLILEALGIEIVGKIYGKNTLLFYRIYSAPRNFLTIENRLQNYFTVFLKNLGEVNDKCS